MRTYRTSFLTVFSLALCASAWLWQTGANAQQPPARPAKPPTGEDEPVAVTAKTPEPKFDEAAKPAPTLLPNQFGNFRFPSTNGKGQVAFVAIHTAPGTAKGTGQTVFVANPEGPWKALREGEKIVNLKDEFSQIGNISINEAGDLTFVAQLAGPLPDNPNAPNVAQYVPQSQGLFVRTAEGVKVLLRLGEEVPNMPSFYSGIANASTNSQGATAFIATYTDPDGKGLFIHENGTARIIARSGQKILPNDTRVFSEHFYPTRINERGEVAWFSRIGSDGGGIFILRNGKIEALALQGKPAPVTYKDPADGKTKNANFIGFGNRTPGLSNNGDVIFAAFYDGPEYGRGLFLKPANGPLQLVVKSGDGIGKGMTANFTDFNFPSINARGEIAFLGNYGARTRGIFARMAKGIEHVALYEQKLPGGTADDMLNNFHQPAINDRGEVVFYGQFRNSHVGIFQWDAAKGLRALARRGQTMPEAK
jgi:hypothetical protein